jgi:hypothetical protein
MKRTAAFLLVVAGLTGCGRPSRPEVPALKIAWPESQVFPAFGPVRTLDVVEGTGRPNDEVTLLVTLQGLINRTEPRIWVLDSGNYSQEITTATTRPNRSSITAVMATGG